MILLWYSEYGRVFLNCSGNSTTLFSVVVEWGELLRNRGSGKLFKCLFGVVGVVLHYFLMKIKCSRGQFLTKTTKGLPSTITYRGICNKILLDKNEKFLICECFDKMKQM